MIGFCCPDEFLQARLKPKLVPGFALPDDQRLPSLFARSRQIPCITRAIAGELCPPEITAGFRDMGETASFMLMPEATMYEDDFPTAREGNVRSPRRGLPLEPETIAKPMEEPPNYQLRFGVGSADTPHMGAALHWRKGIWHVITKLKWKERRSLDGRVEVV